jgi:hypothetical protein
MAHIGCLKSKEHALRRMPLVLVYALIGFAAALQVFAPALHAGAAKKQPVLLAQTASLHLQTPAPAARNIDDLFRDLRPIGCGTTPVSQRERGISRAKSRTGWNVN